MSTVATVSDVSVAIGRPISDIAEIDQVTWWLSTVELQIKARLGDVSLLDQDVVRFVEVEAVASKISNPDGFQYEAIDDYRYGLPEESRRVTILDEWWRLLNPDSGTGAFSVRPGFESDRAPWPWP